MRQWQDKDSAIKTVKSLREKGSTRPKYTNIKAEDGEVKALWSQWESLEIRKGILYRKFYTETKEESSAIYQFVAPKRLRKEIMQHLHNHRTGGHIGITKTLYNVNNASTGLVARKSSLTTRSSRYADVEDCTRHHGSSTKVKFRQQLHLSDVGDYFTKWTQAKCLA